MITITRIENTARDTLNEHYGIDDLMKLMRLAGREMTQKEKIPFRDLTLEQAIVLTKFRKNYQQLGNE
jgi:hypothetical protein